MDGDKAGRTWHLQDEVDVTCLGHEFCEGGMSEDCVVRSLVGDDLKARSLAAEITRLTKNNFE